MAFKKIEEIMDRPPKSEFVPTCPTCKVKTKRTVLKPSSVLEEGWDQDVSWEELYYCPLCLTGLSRRNFTVSASISII